MLLTLLTVESEGIQPGDFLLFILAIVLFLIGVYVTRWIFDIDKIVKTLDYMEKTHEKQLRTQEEMIIQNEKIIRLLQRIAGDVPSSKPQQ